MSDTNKTITENELNDLREIHIPLDLRGLVKGWTKLFHDAPFKLYQTVTRKTEDLSRKMMTGKGSFLGMPVGIILRNTSRAMHNSSEGKYLHSAIIAGGLAAASAVVLGTIYGGPIIAATAAGSFIGSIGSYAAAGLASILILPVPTFTAATLTASTVIGGAVAAFSTSIVAPVNLVVAARRSMSAIKGKKITKEQIKKLEDEFDKDSISARHKENNFSHANYYFNSLPLEKQKTFLQAKIQSHSEFKKIFDQAVADTKLEKKEEVVTKEKAVPTAKKEAPKQ